jgi:hypothetical protein
MRNAVVPPPVSVAAAAAAAAALEGRAVGVELGGMAPSASGRGRRVAAAEERKCGWVGG